MKYKLRLCQGCTGVMEIELPEPAINQYVIELGFKKTDKHWHWLCLERDLIKKSKI